jgi:4Fe-4S single cluster domain
MPLTYTRHGGLKLTDVNINSTLKCNLECVGCNSFSDLKVDDGFTLEQRLSWLDDLNDMCKRLSMKVGSFSILGGEPLLDDSVIMLAEKIRHHWPDSIIDVYSNGLLLSNRISWTQRFSEIGINLEITIHDLPDKIKAKIIGGVMSWRQKGVQIRLAGNSESFDINLDSFWQQTFIYEGDKVYPHDHQDPEIAWLNCAVRDCHTLQDGDLHHCPITALLSSLLAKTGQADDPRWQKYLRYKPLSLINATEHELADFFSRTPGSICSMCPKNVGRVAYVPAIPQDMHLFDRDTWRQKHIDQGT